MKLIFAVLALSCLSSSLAFYSVKKIPSTVIDTSFLKETNHAKRFSFAELGNLMKQASEVSQVNEFLNGLIASINTNRQEKLAIIQQTRAQCSDEETFRQTAITEGQRSAEAATSQLNICTGQRAQAVHLNELATNALAVYNDNLAELTTAREVARKLYESRVNGLNKLIGELAQLNAYIDEIEAAGTNPSGDASFIQATNKLLKTSVKTGHSHLMLPVYTKLIQMHSRQQVDESTVADLRRLIAQVDEAANNSLGQLTETETQDIADFQEQSQRLNNLISKLNTQIAAVTEFQSSMDACISQETSILELSNDKVERNTDLLETSNTLCQAAEDEWRISEQSRAKEINIINALLTAVSSIQQEYQLEQQAQFSSFAELKLL